MKVHAGIMALITALTANFTCASATIIDAGFSPDSITIGKESILEINVSAEKMTGIQFDIIYDSNVLEYVQATVSDMLDDALASGVNCTEPGKISALAVFSEEKQMEGKMCEIEFKAIGSDGDKSVQISNIKLMLDGKRVSEDECTVSFKTKGRAKSGGSMTVNSGVASNAGEEERTVHTTDENTDDENTALEKDNDAVSETKLGKTFPDIAGHWAEGAIQLMLDEGIISGMDDGTFAPDKIVTRAEFAAIIANALNLEEEAENSYHDVTDNAWYAPAILKCTRAELIVGDDGSFRPNDAVTREEMAVIMARAEKYIGIEGALKGVASFSDEEEISSWAKTAVLDIAAAGIINGYDDGTFRPHENTTRAHAAAVVSKLLEKQWNEL